jgi:type IV pilus assembly protein PilM
MAMATSLQAGIGFLKRLSMPLSTFSPFHRESNYLSLDIGSSSVKMLEVRSDDNGLRILNAAISPLPPTAVQNNMIQEQQEVAETIRLLVESTGVRTKEVITAVPGPAVIIKQATFPTQTSEELEGTVLYEAGNFIPESLENVNLDYQIIGDNPEEGQIEVLLVAVRTDIINSYTAAIIEAGLRPVVVDVDYFALENMFEINYAPQPDEVNALINLGARYSTINILKGGRSVFTGDVPVGGRQITESLMQQFGVTYEEAEEAKTSGTAAEHTQEELETFLTLAVDPLLDEIQRALSFFWTGAIEEPLHNIYLSGGTAQLPGLAAMMGERLQAPLELTDPFRQVMIGSQAEEEFLRQTASALAVSVGLATRRPGDK